MTSSTVQGQQQQPWREKLDKLFREHSQFVYRAAYTVTGNPYDAEEVLQTIFLRLVGRDLTDEILANPKGYLHRAAINEAISLLRARQRRMTVPLLVKQTGKQEEENPEIVARAAASERDNVARERLQEAIAQLEPDSLAILVLYQQGFTDAEIAAIRREPRGTISSKLTRIRATLKKLMTEEKP
jgi:RNA polymerase sigma-70 factor (ECF subfamily)